MHRICRSFSVAFLKHSNYIIQLQNGSLHVKLLWIIVLYRSPLYLILKNMHVLPKKSFYWLFLLFVNKVKYHKALSIHRYIICECYVGFYNYMSISTLTSVLLNSRVAEYLIHIEIIHSLSTSHETESE